MLKRSEIVKLADPFFVFQLRASFRLCVIASVESGVWKRALFHLRGALAVGRGPPPSATGRGSVTTWTP